MANHGWCSPDKNPFKLIHLSKRFFSFEFIFLAVPKLGSSHVLRCLYWRSYGATHAVSPINAPSASTEYPPAMSIVSKTGCQYRVIRLVTRSIEPASLVTFSLYKSNLLNTNRPQSITVSFWKARLSKRMNIRLVKPSEWLEIRLSVESIGAPERSEQPPNGNHPANRLMILHSIKLSLQIAFEVLFWRGAQFDCVEWFGAVGSTAEANSLQTGQSRPKERNR